MKIGIIGTAGRREDGPRMSKKLYKLMFIDLCQRVLAEQKTEVSPKTNRFHDASRIILVSGGAAWADHLAVSMFLLTRLPRGKFTGLLWGLYSDLSVRLQLFFPAEFDPSYPRFVPGQPRDPGNTANYYHELFSLKLTDNKDKTASLRGIQTAICAGAMPEFIRGGFKARNLEVARRSDVLIAYTWGEGHLPKDGGTRHTWDHCSSKYKVHVPLSSLLTKEAELEAWNQS